MNKDPIKDYSMFDDHERFQMTIKAEARGDQVLLSRLAKCRATQSPHFHNRIDFSFHLVYLMVIELAKAETRIRMFRTLVLPLANHALDLIDTTCKQGSSGAGRSAESADAKEQFLDEETDKFYSMIAQTLGPSWLAISSVCRSPIGLEPEVILQAWMPSAVPFLQEIVPYFEYLNPDDDIDRELETKLRELWHDMTS